MTVHIVIRNFFDRTIFGTIFFVSQTFQNIEVLLVDDGSPDQCGLICDEYAEKDNRIRVLNKKNGGLSSARNYGCKAATGKWIMFVDGDDWIEPDMFEYLLQNAENYGADIATCGHVDEFNKSITVKTTEQVLLLDTEGVVTLAVHLL